MAVIYNPWSPRFPITLGMILNWARNLDGAIDQITKAYEWRIEQWSTFAGAVLAAILGFVSSVAVSSITEGLHIGRGRIAIIAVGLVALILSYVISLQMIGRIKEEYLQLYGLLLVLKSKLN